MRRGSREVKVILEIIRSYSPHSISTHVTVNHALECPESYLLRPATGIHLQDG